MQISEQNKIWLDTPEWTKFLIDFGYRWGSIRNETRRIALISMPCDSVGAGLVALGAIRKSLEDPLANDVAAHWQRIRKSIGKPLKKRSTSLNGNSRNYLIARINAETVLLKRPGEGRMQDREITARKANEYCFVGEPFVEVLEGHRLESQKIYNEIIFQSNPIIDTNLELSFSGICLAGSKTGSRKTKRIFEKFHFSSDGTEHQTSSLDQLLTVHDWTPKTISRLCFFNALTKTRDRETEPPYLVVADGDGSFLKVIDTESFSRSNIISIIDRSVDRDRLDSLGQRIADLSQWYEKENITPEFLPRCPRGIVVSIWKKRVI